MGKARETLRKEMGNLGMTGDFPRISSFFIIIFGSLCFPLTRQKR